MTYNKAISWPSMDPEVDTGTRKSHIRILNWDRAEPRRDSRKPRLNPTPINLPVQPTIASHGQFLVVDFSGRGRLKTVRFFPTSSTAEHPSRHFGKPGSALSQRSCTHSDKHRDGKSTHLASHSVIAAATGWKVVSVGDPLVRCLHSSVPDTSFNTKERIPYYAVSRACARLPLTSFSHIYRIGTNAGAL